MHRIKYLVMYVLLGMSLLAYYDLLASHGNISKVSSKTTTAVRKRIFNCGYPNPLVQYMFPGYEYMGDNPWGGDLNQTSNSNSTHSNDQDILVIGMFGPRCKIHGIDVSESTAFSGKILYIDGEPAGDAISDEMFPRVYQIGPFPSKQPRKNNTDNGIDVPFWNQHSLLVYHLAVFFFNYIYEPQTFSVPLDDWSDVNLFESSSSMSKSHDEGKTQQKHQEKRNSDSKKKFDEWKQLTQGSGYSNSSDIPKLEDRIPAVVYIATNCMYFRQKAAELLAQRFPGPQLSTNGDHHDEHESKHSFLHFGGPCSPLGGVPVPDGLMSGRVDFRKNYQTIYTRYKYCLVMENTKKDGYITEKLLEALLGGCLPIYYGTKEVYQIFQNNSFVFFDVEQPEEALAEIRRIEANPDEYKKRTDRSRPLLKTNNYGSTSETVDQYFSLFPSIGNGGLSKKIHKMMGLPFPERTDNGLSPIHS